MNLEQIGRTVDFKTLAAGLLLGICLMLLMGARSNERGPYECCTAGANDFAVFVVDTRDGHTWRMSRTDFLDLGTPDNPISERTSTTPIRR